MGDDTTGAPAAPIRVVVVDDHTLFREGLAALLGAAPDTEVVGEAGTGREAIAVVEESSPDVVLMDIMMPELNGIEATQRIHSDDADVAVVVLTMLEDDDSVFAAMCAGARGYLLKGADTDEVLRTVRAAARGEALFGAAIARRLTSFFAHSDDGAPTVTAFPELTDREREVLDLVAAGRSNQQIAAARYISRKTVSNHVSNIFGKLQVSDRAQAIVTARAAGLGRGDQRTP
jgi:DNA-binding NarL/FixJ family response regulator